MRHLVIVQRQKALNFSVFHWSPHGCLIIIGQHFVTTRVVHLPKRTETSLITESDQSRANHQLLQLCTVRTAWSDLDQAMRVVHSCKSWFLVTNYSRLKLKAISVLFLSSLFRWRTTYNTLEGRPVLTFLSRYFLSVLYQYMLFLRVWDTWMLTWWKRMGKFLGKLEHTDKRNKWDVGHG